jgi:hypothetical protein
MQSDMCWNAVKNVLDIKSTFAFDALVHAAAIRHYGIRKRCQQLYRQADHFLEICPLFGHNTEEDEAERFKL